jgi:polysaccharide biosynthesis protein PelE
MNRAVLLLSVADLAAIAIGISGESPFFGWFALIHAGLTLGALLAWFWHQSATARVEIPVIALGAAFGPVGMMAFSLAKPWHWPNNGAKKLTSSLGRSFRQAATQSETPVHALARVLDGRIYFPEASRIDSLSTTLQFGGLIARRKALETIVRSFEPKLSPLIAIALKDRDQTIRALAAAASAQICNDVSLKVAEMAEMEGKFSYRSTLAEKFALAVSLADNGCNNVLLPQTQRAYLCRIAGSHLAGVELQLANDKKRSRQLASALQDIRLRMPDFETYPSVQRRSELPGLPL